MKAAICTKYGSPEVFEIKEVTKPSPKKDEVLVKVSFTNVTSGDIRIRAFDIPKSYWIPARLMLGIFRPRKSILGSVFSGEVVELGEGVEEFKVGDKVFGSNKHGNGAYAEYISLSAKDSITTIPKGYSLEESSAIMWGFGTSLYFLNQGEIQSGDKVLIYGASGSLGTAAVQIAKSMGAKVTGVCSTKNLDLVKKLGADEVIDYKKEDFSKNGKKYDVVYDTVGKINIEKAAESIKPEGFLMHSVGTPANTSRIKKALKGTDKKYIGGTPTMDKDYIEKIKKFVEEKRPDPVIDRTYNLEEIVEAHRYVEKGHKVGNVVVKVP